LRFNDPESATLLIENAGFAVSEEALDQLQREVEGWAAGLRLVLLALYHAQDPDGYLKALHGGIPHVQEFLLQEVLQDLPAEFREYLLMSSIFDRFCPELLEAVVSRNDKKSPPALGGVEALTNLRANNIFTIALDARGKWFRYHHLFQQLLKQQLARQCSSDDIAAMRLRASEWFEDHALIQEAIAQALAAGNASYAAEIVERHQHAELEADRWYVVKKWLDLLPADIKQQRLKLLLAQAWVNTLQLQLAALVETIERAESILDDSAEPASLGELNFFRGLFQYYAGEGEKSQQSCADALARYPEKQSLIAGEMEMYLALARHMNGEGKAAVAEVRSKIRSAGSASAGFISRLVGTEAFVHLLSGDLKQAVTAGRGVTGIGQRSDADYIQAWGRYLEAAAHFQAFRLDDALDGFLAVSKRRDLVTRKVAIEGLSGIALAHQLLKQPEAAASAAETLLTYVEELSDSEHRLAAESCRARLALLRGDLGPAAEWARSAPVEPSAPSMFFWLEDPALTRARIQIAEGTRESLSQALAMLGDLRNQLEALHNTYQLIEILVLQALALQGRESTDEALETMEQALQQGGALGWVRPFVEPGPPALRLLNRLRKRERWSAFVARISSAASGSESTSEGEDSARPQRAGFSLLNSLTQREQEVLELLAERLSDKEIAARLFISPQTVNFHTKNIFQKLGVGNRRQAAAAAADMGLIDRA
jgi:LuxR family maltose regulon positive regulatory protein